MLRTGDHVVHSVLPRPLKVGDEVQIKGAVDVFSIQAIVDEWVVIQRSAFSRVPSKPQVVHMNDLKRFECRDVSSTSTQEQESPSSQTMKEVSKSGQLATIQQHQDMEPM
jgi:hypothetical protein